MVLQELYGPVAKLGHYPGFERLPGRASLHYIARPNMEVDAPTGFRDRRRKWGVGSAATGASFNTDIELGVAQGPSDKRQQIAKVTPRRRARLRRRLEEPQEYFIAAQLLRALLIRGRVLSFGCHRGENTMSEDLTPKLRTPEAAFPSEHMRIIGEICVFWTAMEAMVLQAVCELANIHQKEGMYLGINIPSGTRIELLAGVADTLKDTDHLKDTGKELARLLEKMRHAYLLRNKYAHARLRTNGPDRDPDLHAERVVKRIEFDVSPLTLKQMKADADEVYDACTALTGFLQVRGLCKESWR